VEEADFGTGVMVLVDGFTLFVVERVRVGYNNSVRIKVSVPVQQRILGNIKIYRQKQQVKNLNIFPNKNHPLKICPQK
jgi:hypothetical protein